MESLYKELTNTKTKLDRLMDFWLEGKITEEEHNEKRKNLAERRDLITVEIQQHNQADDKFSERLMDVVKIGGNAYDHFRLSNTEGKRRLVNLVFSTVKLRGRKVEFSLRSPFDTFVKAENIEQWRRVVNTFRTHAPDCLLIVQHKINYTSSQIIRRLAA